MNTFKNARSWKEIITPGSNSVFINLKEIWSYRDLLLIFTRRDILAVYQQTILGPVWFFIQPLLTSIVYVIIFSRVGKFPTGGFPPILFYLSGLVLWSYFSECIVRTSSFMKDNNQILTKVYFPKLVIPLSLIITNLVKFFIQLLLFSLICVYFLFKKEIPPPAAITILVLPVLILMTGVLGLGMGIIVSALTIKYKDLIHLIGFGVQLLMFVSPVLFPLSYFDDSAYKVVVMANPMTGIIETFRYCVFNTGVLSWELLLYDFMAITAILFAGIVLFNAGEKNFADNI